MPEPSRRWRLYGKGKERWLQSLWNVLLLQAKSYWYGGGFEVAEGLTGKAYALFRSIIINRDKTVGSKEGKPFIPSGYAMMAGLRMGCSMNAIAFSKLATLAHGTLSLKS